MTNPFDTIPANATVKEIHAAINASNTGFVIIDRSEGIKELRTGTPDSWAHGKAMAQIRTVKQRSGSIVYEVKAVGGQFSGQMLAKNYSEPVNAFFIAYNYASRI